MSKRRPVITVLCKNCKFDCSTITPSQREKINEYFWSLQSYTERKSFYTSHAKKKDVNRRTSLPIENKSTGSEENKIYKYKRNSSISYFLPNARNTETRVGKKVFLATLGYKETNSNAIRQALKNMNTITLVPAEGNRGKIKNRLNIETRDAAIKEHNIESYKPTISHYRRSHAPNRRYLPQELNITMMHDDFLQKNPKYSNCSYKVYRIALSSLNISFAKLGNEEC